MKPPMQAHIVHAHPEEQSFVGAMRSVIENELKSSGYDITVSDLYRMNWNPILSRDDFTSMLVPDQLAYTKEQRHAYANGGLSTDIKAEAERVLAADLLVLTFPVYWFSVPAIMKGWIDRVFLSGPFYSARRMYGQGGMCGKRALVAASLGGHPSALEAGGMHGYIESMLRHLLHGTLACVGYTVLPPFFALNVPYIDDAARRHCLDSLTLHMRAQVLVGQRVDEKLDAAVTETNR